MQSQLESKNQLNPFSAIRVETAISRYPIHCLAKHGDIIIDIKEVSENGETLIRWEVSHNSKYGQPGPLAYKIDTLLINRRIEEAPRPIPRIVRLGSLNDICRELGQTESGGNTNQVKRALHQNASAYITAQTCYRQKNGAERTLETGFTRYQVIFTGEKLPDGRTADAVYLVLNDTFMQVINSAMTRPLDYDYLKSLPPAPQRFYEILSYQMYAAVRNDRPRAKLVYSHYCTYAPQMRYLDWEHARKQMAKVHRLHKESGYIKKIDYEQTVDVDGHPDWIMFYQPGPRAYAEYQAFTKRGGHGVVGFIPTLPNSTIVKPKPVQLDLGILKPKKARGTPRGKPSPLVARLIELGITDTIAAELVEQYPERIESQLEILDWITSKKPGKIAEPGGWLVSAIKTNHAAPKGFVSAAQRQKNEEARRARERQAAEERQRVQAEKDQERAGNQAILEYWDARSPEEQKALQAAADAQSDPETLKLEYGPMKRLGQTVRRHAYIRDLLQAEGKLTPAKA